MSTLLFLRDHKHYSNSQVRRLEILSVAAQIPVGIKNAGKKRVNYNESKKREKKFEETYKHGTGGGGVETIISHFHGTSR